MLRASSVMVGFAFVLASFTAGAKDFNKLLEGDYAFTGEATCLISFSGFNNGEPISNPSRPFPRVFSFSVHGVRTFNGDGTGKVVARVVSISHPFALPTTPTPVFNRGSASAVAIESDFSYTVTPDLKLEVTTPVVNGTVLSGPRTGQTVQITQLPPFEGFISENLHSLTLAHEVTGVEVHTFSNGDSDERICHRSRVLHERKTGGKKN